MPHIAEQRRSWNHGHSGAVAEPVMEVDVNNNTPENRAMVVSSPGDMPTPAPHLPLRKSSAHRMQSRKGSIPKPIFTPTRHEHTRGLRGFGPSQVHPVPHIDSVTASSEHAFAGRDTRKPHKPAISVLEGQQQAVLQYAEYNSQHPTSAPFEGRLPSSPVTPSSPPLTTPPRTKGKSLKHSKSVGEGLRSLRQRVSSKGYTSKGIKSGELNGSLTPESSSPYSRPSVPLPPDDVRDSVRSALTSHSSFGHASSVLTTQTTHTSLSSNSEYVKIRTEDYEESGGLTDVDMSVEDAIGMYENGFQSDTSALPSPRPSFDVRSIRSAEMTAKNSFDSRSLRSLQVVERPQSQPKPQKDTTKRGKASHRRSQSASILLTGALRGSLQGPSLAPPAGDISTRSSVAIATGKNIDSRPASASAVPRDRYGFKKATHYVSVEQYDEWNKTYSRHIERRSKKWHAFMKQYGLSTSPAIRFPAKSDKVKRYVRKGIPPEFRGAAWFWYAGGPGRLAREAGLYQELLEKIESTDVLSDNDREHIERDLNRTFPDNIKFKPDPTPTPATDEPSGGPGESSLRNTMNADESTPNDNSPESKRRKRAKRSTKEPETPIVQALRRVLQAFAVHNPQIGYCQSLNFIAGLLLLFLGEDEEKSFILLNIVTSQHLPGTHGVALEGANIDIAVLMSCIKDSLPGIWNKLDDKKDTHGIAVAAAVAGGVGGLRLPTVSLATTAWFMSLFVGTLPIETVLRVWDCLFFEGSKTLFRIALAIFKAGEPEILKVSDPMEIFQVVQTIPRSMLDVNSLMEVCFRRRAGFGSVSQGLVEIRRAERRKLVQEGIREGEDNAFRRLRTRIRTRTGDMRS